MGESAGDEKLSQGQSGRGTPSFHGGHFFVGCYDNSQELYQKFILNETGYVYFPTELMSIYVLSQQNGKMYFFSIDPPGT